MPVLCAINAKNEAAAYSAFRHNAETGTPEKRMKNADLSQLLQAFTRKYPMLEQFICNDEGIKLMRIDGDITASIIDQLTDQKIPVLTIHDSYIVQRHHFSALRQAMILASLKYAGRNLLAVQEGFEINIDSSWAVTNERAINKLHKIDQTSAHQERLNAFCHHNEIHMGLSNEGRGLMTRPVLMKVNKPVFDHVP